MKERKGQAMITLLFFVIVGITITSAATIIIMTNSLSTNRLQQGLSTSSLAEAGMENALLRLLRNPNYKGETLALGDGTIQIAVAGSNPFLITSQAQEGDLLRKIEVQTQYINNILTILSWKEMY